MNRQKAAALVEFALAWPVALLIVFATVQAAVWATEAYAARAASLAGARAGTVAGATAANAEQVARVALASSLIGVKPAVWCPGQASSKPRVWVCAIDHGTTMEVDVGGTVPGLVPFGPAGGLPLHARIVLPKEVFSR